MPNNANPEAILVANQKFRVVNDAICTAILSMQQWQQDWNAQSYATLFPNDTNPIQDGATTASGSGPGSGADGRPPITDSTVNITNSNINSLLTTFLASNSLLLNQFLAANVNGKSVI